jgi:hypothetical protein
VQAVREAVGSGGRCAGLRCFARYKMQLLFGPMWVGAAPVTRPGWCSPTTASSHCHGPLVPPAFPRICRVYVHCTAGLGRAPAVCIAYLYWWQDKNRDTGEPYSLDEAYQALVQVRPCGPKRDAIRGATYDVLGGGDFNGFERLPKDAFATLSVHDRFALQYRVLKGIT